ncbi:MULTISPECIES: hypothetical protein [Streptomyces]|uniref:hypothetical protein n=1 Tax=Streptomyces TaxID=1883 RepID=UPI001E387BC5|nr:MULTISPECIES: hypothetical protein [Streptomyces]UFQ20521.1 hypothetical protein J2N69_33070 [Streptomyces huasconensis]WCL90124.1 hypothetical protein PPN52_33020 [Streptomyces sp. JCM 35825]
MDMLFPLLPSAVSRGLATSIFGVFAFCLRGGGAGCLGGFGPRLLVRCRTVLLSFTLSL